VPRLIAFGLLPLFILTRGRVLEGFISRLLLKSLKMAGFEPTPPQETGFFAKSVGYNEGF